MNLVYEGSILKSSNNARFCMFDNGVQVIFEKTYNNTLILPNWTEKIESGSFVNSKVDRVIIPGNIKEIEPYAFIGVKEVIFLGKIKQLRKMKLHDNWSHGLQSIDCGTYFDVLLIKLSQLLKTKLILS